MSADESSAALGNLPPYVTGRENPSWGTGSASSTLTSGRSNQFGAVVGQFDLRRPVSGCRVRSSGCVAFLY